MYATNANSKNEGVRVIDLKCGTTNKQVHQLIRAGLQKFFRADADDKSTDSDAVQGSGDEDEDDDTGKATAASTAAVPAAVPAPPYDIKYENINAHYLLPDDDEEFTFDKLYVQVDRAFDFTEFSQINDDASMSSSSKSGAITLKSCLQRFSVEEQLDKFNEWYCPGCKNHVQAFKTMDLYRLPTILIIQLKRFEYEEGTSYYGQRSTIRNKINSLVDFPITGLDLSGIAKGPQETPAIYDLFAISNHHGGLGGGHYTAYGKNFHNGKWYNFNDAMVSEIGTSQLVTSAAYVLFYRRREPEANATAAGNAKVPANAKAPVNAKAATSAAAATSAVAATSAASAHADADADAEGDVADADAEPDVASANADDASAQPAAQTSRLGPPTHAARAAAAAASSPGEPMEIE